MTTTPHNTERADTGAAVTLSPVEARGAKSVGFIWILVISTVLAVVAMLGFWAFNMGAMNDSQARTDASKAEAAETFDAPAPPAATPQR